jgi:hypothetical protein
MKHSNQSCFQGADLSFSWTLKELQKDKLETTKVIVVQDYQKVINKFE